MAQSIPGFHASIPFGFVCRASNGMSEKWNKKKCPNDRTTLSIAVFTVKPLDEQKRREKIHFKYYTHHNRALFFCISGHVPPWNGRGKKPIYRVRARVTLTSYSGGFRFDRKIRVGCRCVRFLAPSSTCYFHFSILWRWRGSSLILWLFILFLFNGSS